MITFDEVPTSVTRREQSFFETVVSARDRGTLVRQPGQWARIIRRSAGGTELSFDRAEVSRLTAYGAHHSFRIKTRMDKTQNARWHVWVCFAPDRAEQAEELQHKRRERARQRRKEKAA